MKGEVYMKKLIKNILLLTLAVIMAFGTLTVAASTAMQDEPVIYRRQVQGFNEVVVTPMTRTEFLAEFSDRGFTFSDPIFLDAAMRDIDFTRLEILTAGQFFDRYVGYTFSLSWTALPPHGAWSVGGVEVTRVSGVSTNAPSQQQTPPETPPVTPPAPPTQQPPQTQQNNTTGQIIVEIDGQRVIFPDQQPLNVNDRILVPVGGVFSQLGFTPDWNQTLQQATLTRDNNVVVITVGSSRFTTNGVSHELDVPAQNINDRVMLPLGAVLRSLGYAPGWDGAANRVYIYTNNNNAGNGNIGDTPPPAGFTPVLFDRPTLLTSAELISLAETAPSPQQTQSAVTLMNRRLTDAELNAWIAEYRDLGGINAFELEIVRLINAERARYGLQPLYISMELSMAARFHSQEQIDLSYFAHTSPVHGGVMDRVEMFGHSAGATENIGGGIDPVRRVDSWMNSPGHRAAILNSTAVSIGIGAVWAGQVETSGIVTAKFGF